MAEVHNGYFSQDKQGRAKDTRGNTADDEDTYNLIMRDKERLLDLNEPLRFIFSHSALREGWDSPNVFQVCTLNESQSAEKKRQEIGRGLRLPVNEVGERVHDETVNRLTVIANESYEDFARTLQTEFEEDFGIRFGKVEKIAFAKLVRQAGDGTELGIGQEESAKIWHELVANGYINAAGAILDEFDPKNPHFELKVSDEFADLRAEIIDEINRKVFKNRIVQRTRPGRAEITQGSPFERRLPGPLGLRSSTGPDIASILRRMTLSRKRLTASSRSTRSTPRVLPRLSLRWTSRMRGYRRTNRSRPASGTAGR